MSDYKNTLNLPQTDFAMKASLATREPFILKKWAEIGLYEKLRAQGKNRKKFILLDGPPYANGHLHVGHALNKTLKDIIVKSQTLNGLDAPFVPGWDCHGLPIEHNVEKKLGKVGDKLSAAAFRAACREYAASQMDIQREEFIRLGVVGDWYNPYFTMDFKYEANIIRSLAKVIANGHLQKGFKPIHWCLDCASALAEAEVEYADKTSSAIDVRFRVADAKDFSARANVNIDLPVSIPIWTTTPWTLPANQAVALNAELDYSLVDCDGQELLLIAKDLVDAVMQRYGVKTFKTLTNLQGKVFEGLRLNHPFYEKTVPVILGDHVTTDAGTGAVHTAPAHGQDDYVVALRYDLPLNNPVMNNGCYTSDTELLAGVHVLKANPIVIDALKAHQTLIHLETIKHSYPHCWRHKTPLIFRATPQWFISMDQQNLRADSLKAAEAIKWIPSWGESRMQGLIASHPGWCISRQRVWGTPLSLFTHKETGELHPDTLTLMEKVAERVEVSGIEAWHQDDIKTLLGNDADLYEPLSDVLDVWFDSGVAHECVLKARPELKFPADIILEGSDQHRGWFQSGLLTSVAMNGEAQAKTILTHGFTVDEQGRKMSKSLGNVIAPDEVINTLGADVLRLWVASVDYRSEIALSKEILTRTSEIYRRIRNTARFFLANLHGFEYDKHAVKADEMIMLDRFAVDIAKQLQTDITSAYDQYQFHQVVQKIHHFCVNEMGGFYLDVIKDRQYTMAENSLGRRSAQTALYHIVQAFTRWIAPILSFTAEEIWQYIPGNDKTESVFLTEWYQGLFSLPENIVMNHDYWQKILNIRDAVSKEIEKARGQGVIGSALEAEICLYAGNENYTVLSALKDELRFVFITSYATLLPLSEANQDAKETEIKGIRISIQKTAHEKCERCWHRREDVNANPEYQGLCSRCVENVSGKGEVRHYA